ETFARARRLLRVCGHVEWPDGTVARRYAFAHELYRQVVYAQITEEQGARLHRRVGHALEAAYGARKVEIAPRLADHFERSNDHARALRYLLIAVGVARLRFASRAAMEHLVAALALLVRLPEDDQRRRLELELRLALGTALGNIHGFASEHVRQNYERAAALCSSAGSPRQLFAILYARWYAHLIRPERHGAMSTAAELDQLAQRLRSAEHRLVTTSVLLWTAVVDGRFADAQHLMQRRLTHRKGSWGGLAPAFGPEPVLV